MNPQLLDSQLCFSLYAASRLMTQAYAPLLEPLGLTYPQYLVMLVLWEEGEASVSRLGERLALDSGTLTPLITKLAARGYVERRRDDVDARVVRVSLTATGRKLKAKAKSVPHALLCSTGLTPTALARLREELRALTTTLREANAEASTKETP